MLAELILQPRLWSIQKSKCAFDGGKLVHCSNLNSLTITPREGFTMLSRWVRLIK
jgi:hypothetical protein